MDGAIRVEVEAVNTHAAVIISPTLQRAVVVEQISVAVDLEDRVVIRPDADRLQEDPTVFEWPVG